jgi:TrpR family trp operon transcriptional repressor
MNLESGEVAANIEQIASILAEMSDKAVVSGFFYDMFTKSERADIATRWALVKELARKTPQRVIAGKLGLSLCKITRGSRELKKPNSTFAAMLNTIDVPAGS